MDIAIKVVTAICAYLVGSINFATIFARCKNVKIRDVGSGNPGTVNVLRTVGKLWGIMTFVSDALKGVCFALIGRFLVGSSIEWAMIFGVITVVGHIFPIYTRFRGGKGVATSMGVFLAVYPVAAAIALILLIVLLFVLRYGFVGSVVSVSSIVIYSLVVSCDSWVMIGLSMAIWLLVIFAHRSNIIRLVKGKENTLNLTGDRDKRQ